MPSAFSWESSLGSERSEASAVLKGRAGSASGYERQSRAGSRQVLILCQKSEEKRPPMAVREPARMLKALLFESFLLSQQEKGLRQPGETGGLPPQARSLTTRRRRAPRLRVNTDQISLGLRP